MADFTIDQDMAKTLLFKAQEKLEKSVKESCQITPDFKLDDTTKSYIIKSFNKLEILDENSVRSVLNIASNHFRQETPDLKIDNGMMSYLLKSFAKDEILDDNSVRIILNILLGKVLDDSVFQKEKEKKVLIKLNLTLEQIKRIKEILEDQNDLDSSSSASFHSASSDSTQSFYSASSEHIDITQVSSSASSSSAESVSNIDELAKDPILKAMESAIDDLGSRVGAENEKLRRLKTIRNNYNRQMQRKVTQEDIDECVKNFIRVVSEARDGSKNAKTKSSKIFFDSLDEQAKQYVFKILGFDTPVKSWDSFVSLVESGRALPSWEKSKIFKNNDIDEQFEAVLQLIEDNTEKEGMKAYSPKEKLEAFLLIHGIIDYQISENKGSMQVILKTSDFEKISRIELSKLQKPKEILCMYNIYQAMTKAIEKLEKAWGSSEQETKLRKLKDYRKSFLDNYHNSTDSDKIIRQIESFIKEASRPRETFFGGRTDARTASCEAFFNHLNAEAIESVFSALGKDNVRQKDFDSFIDVLNKKPEKNFGKPMDRIAFAMDKAIDDGFISNSKQKKLKEIKAQFNSSQTEEGKNKLIIDFIQLAAEPRGCAPFAAGFAETASCKNFFKALDEKTKDLVFGLLDKANDKFKDLESFIEAVREKFHYSTNKPLNQ